MKQFPATARVFLHGSETPLRQGEIVKQPDLAATIRRLQKSPRDFYEGETARRIAAAMAANGGTITLDDLKHYQAKALPPVEGTYRGHRILSAPPSSSGGTTLLGMLNILERFSMPIGSEGSAYSRHLMVEAMRRAYRDRAEFCADPAFFPVPVERLTSKEHASQLAATIDPTSATPLPARPRAAATESNDTTHFSVVDGSGNLVANTYTLNGFFGSQVIAEGTGVLLNDIMSAFSSEGRNEMAPGKRPVSSMTPTLLFHPDGRPWLALGSPGSATIPNTVLQVIVNLVDYKMSVRDAIEYPRIHHQNEPNSVDAEPAAMVREVAEKMRSFGHVLNPKLRSQGDVHAAGIDPDGWRVGWSDGRRGGRALGY
jgi:gamma-glutamyltranspeptidase/glutathione hydrolase